ncbi:hypothetical protein J437_LFUL000606, partial [Ladona fulva]
MDAICAGYCVRCLTRRWHLQMLRENRIQSRHLRDTSDPFQLSDACFQGWYQLTKGLVQGLIDEVRPLLAHGERVTSVPVEIKVLCALHFYGQGSYQGSAGSDFWVSLSQPSVSRAVKKIMEALNSPQLLGKWIVFPQGQRERMEIIQNNYQATAISGVLGYVDGTHIPIKAPPEDEHLYFNRKHYHSINAQIVCDSGMRILNVLARHPGSAHNSHVWKNSAVRKKLEDIWAREEQCWLVGRLVFLSELHYKDIALKSLNALLTTLANNFYVGDSGYPHELWLHTPILNAEEGSPEARYQRHHTRARSAVECYIGVLKGRFKCLIRKLEYSPLKVCQITNACCVLHNVYSR